MVLLFSSVQTSIQVFHRFHEDNSNVYTCLSWNPYIHSESNPLRLRGFKTMWQLSHLSILFLDEESVCLTLLYLYPWSSSSSPTTVVLKPQSLKGMDSECLYKFIHRFHEDNSNVYTCLSWNPYIHSESIPLRLRGFKSTFLGNEDEDQGIHSS